MGKGRADHKGGYNYSVCHVVCHVVGPQSCSTREPCLAIERGG